MLINSNNNVMQAALFLFSSPHHSFSPRPSSFVNTCWSLFVRGGVKFFFSLFFEVLLISFFSLYVSVCGWLWRNYGMLLYNDDTFHFCVNWKRFAWDSVWLAVQFPRVLFLSFYRKIRLVFLWTAFECSAHVMSDQNNKRRRIISR